MNEGKDIVLNYENYYSKRLHRSIARSIARSFARLLAQNQSN